MEGYICTMDGVSLVRLRWRLHGAWMWPTFVGLALLDGLLLAWHPITGDRQSFVGGWLLGVFLSLVGVVVAVPLFGMILRRVRPDMPKVVARDYAGTGVVMAVTVALFAAGLAHHATITADQHALQDAVARAEAFIGDRAPAQFAENLASADTYEIQPPRLYRTCVPNPPRTRYYCVVVDRRKPFASSVRASGSEPNQILSQDTW
jgi:hypothetical protein